MPRTKTEDMIGKRYGYLTVLEIDHYELGKDGYKRYYVKCKCDCGNEKVVLAYSLTRGLTVSCGCYQKIVTSNAKRTHGKSKSRLYSIFNDMHRRCEDPTRKIYPRYGGRGITVCPEWNRKDGFPKFDQWSMSHGYADNLTIDRIDNDKGYSPDNCRWVDYITQANNTSWNKLIEYDGEIHTMAEWGRIKKLNQATIKNRLNHGWTVGEALGYEPHTTPHKDEVLYTINGITHNIREWCRIQNLSVDTVRYRREHNWPPEEIFGFKEHINGTTY